MENKKLLLEFEQELYQLNEVKKKYDWSLLVEQMSKNAANLIVLKKPEIPRPFESKEPNLLINLILGCLFSFTTACCSVYYFEVTDKNLSFSHLNYGELYYPSFDQIDFRILQKDFMLLEQKKLLIVLLASSKANKHFENTIKDMIEDAFEIIVIDKSESITNIVHLIKNMENILFFARIGETDKHFYSFLMSKIHQLKTPKSYFRSLIINKS